MNRREYVTAGCVAIALPLAGCTAGSDDEDNRNGEESDGNGQEEETLVEVLEHNLEPGTLPSVVGILENVSGEELSSVRVQVDFFDADDVLIGEGLAMTMDLPADQKWEFDASYTDQDQDQIDRYELETKVTR